MGLKRLTPSAVSGLKQSLSWEKAPVQLKRLICFSTYLSIDVFLSVSASSTLLTPVFHSFDCLLFSPFLSLYLSYYPILDPLSYSLFLFTVFSSLFLLFVCLSCIWTTHRGDITAVTNWALVECRHETVTKLPFSVLLTEHKGPWQFKWRVQFAYESMSTEVYGKKEVLMRRLKQCMCVKNRRTVLHAFIMGYICQII